MAFDVKDILIDKITVKFTEKRIGAVRKLGAFLSTRFFGFGLIKLHTADLRREIVGFKEFISNRPKPIVFGVYGALGGLLGALLLGEPVWAILKPPPPPKPQARVAVTVSPAVEVFLEGTNSFTVQIARDLFDAPVVIEVANCPPGISLDALTIPAGATEGTLTVRAAPSASTGSGTIEFTARSNADNSALSARAELRLNVLEAKPPAIDVMFVLDVTGSMQFAIEGVRDGIARFASGLSNADLDFRVGLLAFRDERINESAELLRFDGVVFTADIGDFQRQVSGLNADGGGDDPESALDGLLQAADQPFRSEVTRVILLITDAPPAIPDARTESMQHAIALLQEKGINQLHLVVPPSQKSIFEQLWRVCPGQYFDLDDVRNGGDGFARLMPQLSQVIAEASASARPDQNASLSESPPPAVLSGVQSSSQFDARAVGQLVLAVSCWTGAIASLITLVLCIGQFHYLRSAMPSPVKVFSGFIGGLIAGCVGGATGQSLFLLTPDNPIIAASFRIFGWMMLGALAGFGLSFFIPNMRRHHGLAGGAAGGAIGALGFLAVTQLSLGGEMTGRIMGAVILGFCIGLMVAFMESAFRSAWLEVHRGKEMITVNLGPEAIRVGSNKRQCTVWTAGAPDIALKYWVKGGQVICFDVVASRETIVRSGDRRTLGRVELVVRTGIDARAANVARPSLPPPPGQRPMAKPSVPVVPSAAQTPPTPGPAELLPAQNAEKISDKSISTPPATAPRGPRPGTTETREGQSNVRKKPPLPPPPPRRV